MTHYYGKRLIYQNLSFDVPKGRILGLLGKNGTGKTTLLNILGGLDHADSGDIVINGISTKDYTDKDWDTYRNHRIGFIFQSYNLMPNLLSLIHI